MTNHKERKRWHVVHIKGYLTVGWFRPSWVFSYYFQTKRAAVAWARSEFDFCCRGTLDRHYIRVYRAGADAEAVLELDSRTPDFHLCHEDTP